MCVFASNTKIVIELEHLNDYTDIIWHMKKHGIHTYVYEFAYKGQTIKYGYSADNARIYGDRIYRQAGHLPGWQRPALIGPSGAEMYFINQDYIRLTGQPLNRNGMVITVTSMNTLGKVKCEELERYLIDSYITVHGTAPIGNKDSRTTFEVRRHHNEKHLRGLFDL